MSSAPINVPSIRSTSTIMQPAIPTMRSVSHEPAQMLRHMYQALLKTYGPQQWWPAETSLEVIVGAYLTQGTSWRAVEQSIVNLRAADALGLEALRAISEAELRILIRPSGFMQRKAASIKAFIRFLDQQYDGSLELLAKQETSRVRIQLLSLPGVGPETADAILLYALHQPVMVVDEYLRRIVVRHGLADEGSGYSHIQQIAGMVFAADAPESRAGHFNEFHALVVETGKRHCKRKAECNGCPLSAPQFHPPAQGALNAVRLARAATRK